MKKNMHHRMGSYFETQGVIIPPAPHPPPKKGILMAPSGPPPPPPPPTSSIPTRKAKEATMASSADLVKSERSRRNLQRLKFEYDDMRQITALNKRLASLTIADMSPKLALQRILALYERGDHREAAGFIRRLTYATFRYVYIYIYVLCARYISDAFIISPNLQFPALYFAAVVYHSTTPEIPFLGYEKKNKSLLINFFSVK